MGRWISNLGKQPLQNLGSVAYCYIAILAPPLPLLPSSDVLLGGGASPSCPNTPATDVRLVSAQDYLPPGSHLSPSQNTDTNVPLPQPSLSVTSPLNLILPSPHLPNSCHRRSLAASGMSSNVTLSCFSDSACLHHGTWIFPPPS